MSHSRPPLAVFCDYDGTFAKQDVGSTLAKRYAGERRGALWERLSRGELTAPRHSRRTRASGSASSSRPSRCFPRNPVDPVMRIVFIQR